ncbi:uncharacterized protein LOC135829139 [Sycon ciliatum]|uniref:uncharacterized protein LOC135829139 n=1 Tax=Sycon ciliatum TaxID=27933 RepID=UPI0031F67FFC
MKVTLAFAKSRQTPIKKLSIPKLELKGAVLGVQLSKELEAALKIPLTEHRFWTASLNVLYWLRSHSRRFLTDIGVKISEIQRATSPLQWQHVPGKINPADLPTGGMLPAHGGHDQSFCPSHRLSGRNAISPSQASF